MAFPLRKLLLGLAVVACAPPLDTETATFSIVEESGARLDEIPPVPRLYLWGMASSAPADLWLVRGQLSSVAQKDFRRRDPPQKAADNRVPLAVWSEGDAWVLAPTIRLVAGQVYSLAALGQGLVAQLTTSEDSGEWLRRVGNTPVTEDELVFYCPEAPAFFQHDGPDTTWESPLPDGVEGGVSADGWGSPCVRMVATTTVQHYFIPPARAGEFFIDPEPIAVEPQEPGRRDPPADTQEQVPPTGPGCFEYGCFRITDASLELTGREGSYAFELSGDERRFFVVSLQEGSAFRWGPLAPQTTYSLRVLFLDAADENGAARLELESGPAAARLVLSEVLGDPTGPEPRSEWVELFNAGTHPANLSDFLLADEAGSVPLPDVILKPGAYGLAVRRDFTSESDVVPAADATPLIVSSLGGNGLRNSGEAIRLLDRQGNVHSAIPALSTTEGVSLARRELYGGDDPENFAAHSPPGCSPGAANAF